MKINMNKLYTQMYTILDFDDTNKMKFINANSLPYLRRSICNNINIYNSSDNQIEPSDIISLYKISDEEEVYNAYVILDNLKGTSNHFIINSKEPVEIFIHYISTAFMNTDIILHSSLDDNDIKIIRNSIEYIISETIPNYKKFQSKKTIKNKSIIQQYYQYIPDFIMIRSLNALNNNAFTMEQMSEVLGYTDNFILTNDQYNSIKELYSTDYFYDTSDYDKNDFNNMIIVVSLFK